MIGTIHDTEVLRVDDRREHRVRVLKGTAYVTMEGDAADYFLKSGQELKIEKRHLTLVQGWPEAEVQVD